MRIGTSLVLAFVSAGSLVSSLDAATLTLRDGLNGYTGTASTTIRSDSTSYNDNTSGTTTMLVGKQDTRDFRGLISFDISSLNSLVQPGETLTITSVSLTLVIADARNSSAGMTFTVSSYATDPMTATWTNPDANYGTETAGGTPGTNLSTLVSSSGTGTAVGDAYTAGSSAAFVSAANDALAGNGLLNMMLWNNATGSVFGRFGMDTYANSAYRPVLNIEYEIASIPEAASLGLLGLGALAMLRRRH